MDRRPRARRQAGPKKPLTEAELERRALAYAERFASTKTRFLAVLRRTIRRRGPSDNDAALEALALRLVERFSGAGLVDDLRFAEARAARLHRQGHPARAIAERLRVAGVPSADIASAIDNLVKGAAGQAVQCMNLLCGLEESCGLGATRARAEPLA